MKYNPNFYHRKSIRLKNYDYSQAGLYFVAIVTQNTKCLFGIIVDGERVLNDAEGIVKNVCLAIPKQYKQIRLHECCGMPNHLQTLFEITVGATLLAVQNYMLQPQEIVLTTVGEIIIGFKSMLNLSAVAA